tara:strand:+ start:492 stop:872 length:381 start_codon:yes stop_codon:yes gene_type:complete
MNPVISGMPHDNVPTEMNPYGTPSRANVFGTGIHEGHFQRPAVMQNFPQQGGASQRFIGNGAGGGPGLLESGNGQEFQATLWVATVLKPRPVNTSSLLEPRKMTINRQDLVVVVLWLCELLLLWNY